MAIYSLLGYANQQPDVTLWSDEARASMFWSEAGFRMFRFIGRKPPGLRTLGFCFIGG
jgi:hypothetical protein